MPAVRNLRVQLQPDGTLTDDRTGTGTARRTVRLGLSVSVLSWDVCRVFGFLLRKLLLVVLLAASVAVPYAWYQGGKWSEQFTAWKAQLLGGGGAAELRDDDEGLPFSLLATASGPDKAAQDDSQNTRPPRPRLVGPEIRRLEQVLRFGATPSWVMSYWSRVSRVHDDEYWGLRVPLVTGTDLDDLAGSLTYYFDDQDVVQRIVFRGRTGDARKLTHLVQQVFRLRREPSTDGTLYVARWNGAPTSMLRVHLAPVVQARSVHSRFRVYLEVNRPRAYLRVSDEMERWAERARPRDTVWRW